MDSETKYFYNQLVKMFGETGLEELIEQKKDEYSHLIPLENIVRILYYKNIKTDTKIGKIYPGVYFINVTGFITKINSPVTVVREDSSYIKYSFVLIDETGEVNVVTYTKDLVDSLVIGSKVNITNALCRYMKVYLKKKTEIKFLFKPKFLDLSCLQKDGKYYLLCNVVTEMESVPYIVKGEQREIPTFKVADKTGTAIVTVWNTLNFKIKPGCRIRMENVKYYRNEIHVSGDSRLVVVHCPEDDGCVGEFSKFYFHDNVLIGVFGSKDIIVSKEMLDKLFGEYISRDIDLKTIIKLKEKQIFETTYSLTLNEVDNKLYLDDFKRI